jgi:hypothetical protein
MAIQYCQKKLYFQPTNNNNDDDDENIKMKGFIRKKEVALERDLNMLVMCVHIKLHIHKITNETLIRHRRLTFLVLRHRSGTINEIKIDAFE